MRLAAVILSGLATLAAAQEPTDDGPSSFGADVEAFEKWLAQYRQGAFRIMRGGVEDRAAITQVDMILGSMARWNTLASAKRLFAVACVQPSLGTKQVSTDRVSLERELQPWKVRSLARKHIAAMEVRGLDRWLALQLQLSARGAEAKKTALPRAAAMRILALRDSVPGILALLKATQSLPPQERVRAVNSLSVIATQETIPHFIGLLRDNEPNVRIAALNALGKSLAPLTDETELETITTEHAKLRDQVISRMKPLLLRDRVWQVRAAAAENLAKLRSKHVIPVLIAGLKAETSKKKDPWALDMRIHRLLEGLTGQKILPGNARLWEAFWRKEGASFRYTGDAKLAKESASATRYQKFFSIDIESDRVVFVLDFSGSMAEPVTLKSKTTSASPGTTTTKAKLVVEELKKIVMGLPDGTMFNLVVFSEEVSVWREQRDGQLALVKLDDTSRDDLLGSYFDSLQPAGATNLYGALDRILNFAGRGLYDKYYGLAFDTVYVLSDGAPSWGKVIDKDEIIHRVTEANRLRKLNIHTVTFGDKNATEFLARLAKANGGRHIHVE